MMLIAAMSRTRLSVFGHHVAVFPAPLFETWLFGLDGDLYGKRVAVELVAFLRPEAKFADLDALKKQITANAEAARTVLAGLIHSLL